MEIIQKAITIMTSDTKEIEQEMIANQGPCCPPDPSDEEDD